MEKLKIFWSGEMDKEGFEAFSKFGDIECSDWPINTKGHHLTEEELKEKLKDVDLYICGYDPVTENVLYEAERLKLILSVRDGPEENIDVKACEKHGIPVLSSAGRCAVSVSELTISLMLLCARPVIRLTNYIHSDGWTKENGPDIRMMYENFSTELFRKTVGVIGLGRNGYNVAKMCQAFNMNVIAYDPYVNKEKMEAEGFTLVDLDTLMSTADYVVVLSRLTPETQGMVGRREIGLMKENACLINPGRGKLIDNDALFDALEQDKIRMAALDAHPVEPLGLDNRALKIDPNKLILTPHMAGKTAERNWHQYQLLLSQFEDYIDGKDVRMPYTPKVTESEEYAKRGKLLYGVRKEG